LDSPSINTVDEMPSVVKLADSSSTVPEVVDTKQTDVHAKKHNSDDDCGEPPRLNVSESVASSAASSKPYAQPAANKTETVVKSRSAMVWL